MRKFRSFAIFKLWHYLRQDFPQWPQLSFKKALALVFLWGLAFHLVLVMIAGTRELMTPEAWEKSGLIYQLAPNKNQLLLESRRYKLERLKMALWRFADEHEGQFPAKQSTIVDELWLAPTGQFRYQYIEGLTTNSEPIPLAYEPDNYGAERMVLLTNGMIELFPIEIVKRKKGI